MDTTLVDDMDTRRLKLKDLRQHARIVSQMCNLFNTRVAKNIAYAADGDIDKERLKQAAVQDNAIDFIDKLDAGFETPVGENGSKLSGGQRQRIAIARALYKNSKIVILDEATSALDTESERAIQKAFDSLTTDKTTLVIAHRLSTIEKADKILVLDHGRIIESGKHQELLDKNGFYANLYQLQFKDKEA